MAFSHGQLSFLNKGFYRVIVNTQYNLEDHICRPLSFTKIELAFTAHKDYKNNVFPFFTGE